MRQQKALKPTPTFDTEDQELEFWATADSTDYVDWSRAERMRFPTLRISTRKASC